MSMLGAVETGGTVRNKPLVLFKSKHDFISEANKILKIISMEVFVLILKSKPDSRFDIVRVTNEEENVITEYGRWKNHLDIPESLKNVNWSKYLSPVMNQEDHNFGWAIVVSDLVGSLRSIAQRDRVETRYSTQELIDFVDPKKGKANGELGHFCYTLSITKGLDYVIKNGIQREEERPFVGCRSSPPPRVLTHPELGYIGGVKENLTIEEAIRELEFRPLGAGLAIFFPDYEKIYDGIYRGPRCSNSTFSRIHAVTVVAAGQENGESYMLVKSSHGVEFGDGGYFKVSIDTVIIRTSKCEDNTKNYFIKPTRLLTRFCYPELLDEEEEKGKKKKMQREIA